MTRTKPRPQTTKLDPDILRELSVEHAVASGDRVQKRRIELGLHRRELAQIAGTSEPTIIRIETGILNPKDSLRMAIAGALCVEVDTLWGYPPLKQIVSRAAA